MIERVRKWYQRPPGIFAIVCLGLVLGWLGWVGWLTVQNIRFIKSGKDPLALVKQKKFQASISQAFLNASSTTDDLSRLMPRGDEPTLGNPHAKVRIIEFVDYDCPFCRQTAPVLMDFMRRHTDDAYLVLRDFPLSDIHPTAKMSARAARCVWNQGNRNIFWSFYARLFVTQSDHSPEAIRLYAQQLGVDLAAFDVCVASERSVIAIKQSFDDGVSVGVRGTPTFFFNGVKIEGAIDAESLEAIFEAAKTSGVKI